jgi:iron(III) transport system substrate-binding protein
MFGHHRLPLLLLTLTLLAASGSTASVSRGSTEAKSAKPLPAKEWNKLVAQAKREGSVTIYSTQIPTLLADMAAKFKAKYGIAVTVNRQVDNVLATQVTAEEGTGKASADLWVANSKAYVLGSLKNGWVTEAVGPHSFSKGFDRSIFAKPGKSFVVGSAVLGYGWNTGAYRTGLGSFRDLLNPSLVGKVGVLQPLSPVAVDWYLWLGETYGKDFITKLAAMKPKIYPSSVPMQQALTSGEISAGSFLPTTTLDLISQGAPVQFKLPQHPWNTPYYAMILKQAPHPAAAQVLADYMLSAEGQQSINHHIGSVLKNVPETSYVIPRIQKLSELTPAKVTAFQSYWNGLFK